jgi:hypothetical protein
MEITDQSRLVPASSDSDTLTIEDALALYAEAGIPRTLGAPSDTAQNSASPSSATPAVLPVSSNGSLPSQLGIQQVPGVCFDRNSVWSHRTGC